MGSIFVLQGLLIYIYCFDHNPPHIHVRTPDGNFTVTIKDRVIEGKAKVQHIYLINKFLDEHEDQVMQIWEKAQRGEKMTKIK